MNEKSSSKFLTRAAFVAYFTLAIGTSIGHDWLLDMRVEPVAQTLHLQVMTNKAPAPIQYRIFQYYAAEGLIRLGVPFRGAYFSLRFLFTFLAAAALHVFLGFFFAPVICVLGTLYFFAVLPLVYYGYFMQPMDIPNLFFMLAGCILILKKKDLWLVPLIFVAMLNRETAILLVLVYLFVRSDELKLPALALRTGLMFAVGMLTYAALRKVFSMKHYYADLYYLGSNLSDPKAYLHALALFGPFIPLSLMKFGEKPKFIRRAMLFVPFFVIIHYTMTIMREPRLWLPVLPFMLAAGLWTVVPQELKLYGEDPKPCDNAVTRNPRAAYALVLASFLVFFTGFFFYYKNAHFSDREKKLRVERIILDARSYALSQMPARAVEELNKAIILDPENAEPHYQLAMIYDNTLYDYPRALEQFRETLRLDPYHIDKQRVEKEIERLEYTLKK